MPTLTLQPDGTNGIDTYINDVFQDRNYGISTGISAGNGNGGLTYKGLIKFDLSSIPANVRITNATLRMIIATVNNGAVTANHEVRRSLVEWYEGASSSGVPGAGVNASTWDFRNHNGSVAWSGGEGGASGTEYASTATDTQALTSVGQTINWDVTSDVVGFYNSTYPNYGWWVGPLSGFVNDSLKTFYSSDYGTPASRPQLIIEYEIVQDITLAPVADTYINQASPTFNYGESSQIALGFDAASQGVRGMIKFDLSAIPSDAYIISALLRVYCESELNSTDRTLFVYRFLVEWFEGVSNGAAPGGGQDATTWNHRNANGSVAWASGAGGGSAGNGVESASPETGSVSITGTGAYFDVNVAVDVQNFVDGTHTNYGWWLRGNAIASSAKFLSSSESATEAFRPQLIIEYSSNTVTLEGTSLGEATAQGTIHAAGYMEATSEALASVTALLLSNEYMRGDALGQATGTATIHAAGYMAASLAVSATVTGDIQGDHNALATASGSATVSGDISGHFYLSATSSGSSAASAVGSFQGQLYGSASGIAVVTAVGWAYAKHVARAQGCYDEPLLYITDGTVKANGQLNRLNLINAKVGFILNNWRPAIAQYKEGGIFSDSAHGTGRRLVRRTFANAIEVFDLKMRAGSQDKLIEYQQELLSWQEAAADFWTSDWGSVPIYLVAKAAMESNPRYAIIYAISVPELENPYAQPFYNLRGSAIEQLTLRLERGDWTSSPPGQLECVAISSQRSWTVSGWITGS